MNENSPQEIISTLHKQGVGTPYISTFVFLLGYGENSIQKPQQELADQAGIKKRTLRHHLYKLRDAGLISYNGDPAGDIPTIELKRFKHS